MDDTQKGLISLIEDIARQQREKRDFTGRWCEFFTEDCISKMERYGEKGYLCENHCEYCDKFKWIVDRAKHYAEKTRMPYTEILRGWEEDRRYWFMNFYQEGNQPKIKDEKVHIFETIEEYRNSLKGNGFICPKCGTETDNPQLCSCGWKSFALLGTLGKGVTVFIKENVSMAEIFMPIAWAKNIKTN